MEMPFACVPAAFQRWQRRSYEFPLEMTLAHTKRDRLRPKFHLTRHVIKRLVLWYDVVSCRVETWRKRHSSTHFDTFDMSFDTTTLVLRKKIFLYAFCIVSCRSKPEFGLNKTRYVTVHFYSSLLRHLHLHLSCSDSLDNPLIFHAVEE